MKEKSGRTVLWTWTRLPLITPVNISLVPVKESKSHRLTLAEQMTF